MAYDQLLDSQVCGKAMMQVDQGSVRSAEWRMREREHLIRLMQAMGLDTSAKSWGLPVNPRIKGGKGKGKASHHNGSKRGGAAPHGKGGKGCDKTPPLNGGNGVGKAGGRRHRRWTRSAKEGRYSKAGSNGSDVSTGSSNTNTSSSSSHDSPNVYIRLAYYGEAETAEMVAWPTSRWMGHPCDQHR